MCIEAEGRVGKMKGGLAASEMIPAEREKRAHLITCFEENGSAGGQFTNAGDGHAAEVRWNARQIPARDSEKEFIVFTAVESAVEMRRAFDRTGVACERKRTSVNDGTDAACGAEAREIGGEAV